MFNTYYFFLSLPYFYLYFTYICFLSHMKFSLSYKQTHPHYIKYFSFFLFSQILWNFFAINATRYSLSKIFPHKIGLKFKLKLDMYGKLLWIYFQEGRQFVSCVLFRHVDISQTATPLTTFLVPLEGPQCLRVHQVGLIMLRFLVEKLLNIEYFFI